MLNLCYVTDGAKNELKEGTNQNNNLEGLRLAFTIPPALFNRVPPYTLSIFLRI